MKLQIAVDVADTKRILEIGDQIHDVIDIYEVGTPVIMKEGMIPVKSLKQKYPDLCVLADTKIVDGGALECKDVCEAGADIITVLALADEETIREVCDVAHTYGRKVLADLICVEKIPKKSKQLIDLGVDYIGVHTGVDMQKKGRTPYKDLQELIRAVDHSLTAVAGGLNLDTIDSYVSLSPEIVIAGSSLYNSKDIRQSVIEMKAHLV